MKIRQNFAKNPKRQAPKSPGHSWWAVEGFGAADCPFERFQQRAAEHHAAMRDNPTWQTFGNAKQIKAP